MPGATRKSVALPLNMIPVGDPGAGWLGALGTITIPVPLMGTMDGTGGLALVTEYKVAVPAALFADHHGLPGLATSPQGFLRLGSIMVAAGVTGMSDTKLVCM